MEPTLQPTDQNGHVPVAPTTAQNDQQVPAAQIGAIEISPPRAIEHDFPSDNLGQARLNEAIGKAVAGTVIPSDIRPNDLPTLEKLEVAEKANNDPSPSPPQPQPVANGKPGQQETPASITPPAGAAVAAATAVAAKTDTAAPATTEAPLDMPGSIPLSTRIGWIEAYKRTDGPKNEFRDKSIWMDEFASSALYGAFWHNAAVVIVLPIVCFIVFKFGGGVVSLILIIAFGATFFKNSIRRFRRNARDDLTRELIKNTLEIGTESTEWINNFMAKFWLIYEPVLSATVVQVVDSILVDQTPAFLDSIRLTTFTLGTKAPRVESVKTYPKTDPDVVMMDWRVLFTPTDTEDMTPAQMRTQINPKICLTVRLGKGIIGAGMPILVEDMSFKGHMRFKLKLTANFPHIKTVDFSFLEPPEIDYCLKPVGGETFGVDIAHIPGLQSFIRDQTHAILGPMMYAPNVYTLDLEQIMTGGASLTAAAGVVQFTIYNAKDLKNTELVGNSDPYIKIRLGNRPDLATTAVKQDTLNPVWNETNTILVNNLNEVVCMEIMDKDNLRKDRPLGQANFDLKSLEEEPIQDDIWCKVLRNGKERGAVRVRAAYFPVQPPQPSADGSQLIPVESNSGILAISLAQAKDIARTGKTKSLCNVYLNGRLVHTTKKMIGANPAWGAEVDIFLTDLEAAQISVEVVSDGQVIGTYAVPGQRLIKDTEKKDDWVTLQGGEGTGKLRMTGIWKPILMGDDLNPSHHKPAFGVIRIQLFGGRDLRNVEIGGSSDPYVVITGEKGLSRGRTKVIDSNLNPVWNEIFYVAVNSMKQAFEFEVFDFQKVTKDRTLGKTSFKVSELIDELPDKAGYEARSQIDRWAPLTQKDGSSKGDLHYKLTFYPSLKIAQEVIESELKASSEIAAAVENIAEAVVAAEEAGAVPVDQEKPAEAAPLETAVTQLPKGSIYAHEALDYDSGILVTHLMGAELDRSGTYCEFYIDSDSYQFRSQMQKSRNPKWNEIADIFVKELEYAKLVILVKEKSSMEKDPVIGNFTCNIRTLLETMPADGAHFPILDKNEKRGTLHLRFEYLPVPIELLPRERLDNMGNLTVTLVRAKDLIAADRGGASDPYVVFRVNGKDVYKSEVIKKTLNPEYNETFVIPIASRDDDQFTFEVFDWNQISTAKSLGLGALDLRNIQLVLPNEFLVKLRNKQNQGEVQVKIKFMPEFLSSNKRKSGFGATFIGSGVGAVASGGQFIGQAGLAGVGAVAGGVGTVGQGALDVGGAVGKGAIKGVGAVGKGVGKGVGAVGKGVFGGISTGVSALGLKRSDKNDSPMPLEASAPVTATSPTPTPIQAPVSTGSPSAAPASMPVTGPTTSNISDPGNLRSSSSEASLNSNLPLPRTSVGSIRSRTSMVFDSGDMVGEPGTLTIHMIEAEGLMGVDKSGTSDPYVKIRVGNNSVLKTKVKKENLAPIWNESVVVSGITGHPVTINFLVRDHNTLGSDKDLGEFDLRLWEYIQPNTEAHSGEYKADFWAPLGGTGGKIHIALDFEPMQHLPHSQLEPISEGKKRSLFSRK